MPQSAGSSTMTTYKGRRTMDDILRIIRSRHSTRGAVDLTLPITKEVLELTLKLPNGRRHQPICRLSWWTPRAIQLGSSVWAMLENMCLVCESLEQGLHVLTVVSDGPVEQKLKDILHVPDHMKIAFAGSIGYSADPSATYTRVRRDLSDLVHHNNSPVQRGKRQQSSIVSHPNCFRDGFYNQVSLSAIEATEAETGRSPDTVRRSRRSRRQDSL